MDFIHVVSRYHSGVGLPAKNLLLGARPSHSSKFVPSVGKQQQTFFGFLGVVLWSSLHRGMGCLDKRRNR